MNKKILIELSEDQLLCAIVSLRKAYKTNFVPSDFDENINCDPYEVYNLLKQYLVDKS